MQKVRKIYYKILRIYEIIIILRKFSTFNLRIIYFIFIMRALLAEEF